MGVVEEEADEAAFWLEIAADLDLPHAEVAGRLHKEANEITSIVVSSRIKLKHRIKAPKKGTLMVRETLSKEPDLFDDMPFDPSDLGPPPSDPR